LCAVGALGAWLGLTCNRAMSSTRDNSAGKGVVLVAFITTGFIITTFTYIGVRYLAIIQALLCETMNCNMSSVISVVDKRPHIVQACL